MKYFKKIVGKKLYLSPMNIEDYETYTNWLNEYETAKGINQVKNLIGTEKEKEILERIIKEQYNFAIISLDDDQLIGNISLLKINEIDRNAELGIFIGDEKNRNKGYGKEAIKLLLDYGFNQINLHNIILKAFSFNERAIATYKKVGFKEFGIWKESHYFNGKYCDEVQMQILKEDFNQINIDNEKKL